MSGLRKGTVTVELRTVVEMRPVGKTALAVAVLSVLTLAVLAALYIQLSLDSLTIGLREVSVSLGKSNVTVAFKFELRNPSPLSAHVVDLPFSVELADYQLGKGTISVPFIVPGNGYTESLGKIEVPYSQLPAATVAALKQYVELRTLKYKIHGTVTLKVIMLDVKMPFELRGDVFKG